ncbi:MAG: Gfo/Idh/MocA family oxidoreductase [Rhodospirillaceae bacterium]|jgi:predicted dehydrogenase|nr:Gfo/Idh/MocA family oxidoreductase [Rhodospirillaceae bacterium]
MINAAIYGIGRWGQNLVKSVQGKSDKINFAAAITRTPENHADFGSEMSLSIGDDYDAVLDDENIDAVVLATVHSHHAEQIKLAAGAGKHVFCEKPLALTKNDAEEAAQACAAAGVVLGVGFARRFLPAFADMKQLISEGAIGDILHMEAMHSGPTGYRTPPESWRALRSENPAGGMAARGIHNLDLMIELCGEVSSVYAASDHRAIENDMDDTTSMMFQFKNGSTGYLSTIFATGNIWRMYIMGTKGWLEMRGEHCLVVSDLDNVTDTRNYDEADTLKAELEAFADACDGAAAYPVPVDHVVHGISVFEAVDESAKSGTKIEVE